jgi:hypothetical protein
MYKSKLQSRADRKYEITTIDHQEAKLLLIEFLKARQYLNTDIMVVLLTRNERP